MRYILVCSLLAVIITLYFRYTFLNKNTLFKVLSDKKYLKTFTDIDLRVRRVQSVDEYIDTKIQSSLSDTSIFEKLYLILLTCIIDIRLLIHKVRGTGDYVYFDLLKFLRISWSIGIVNGTQYEEGLSHTRNGTIIVSRNTLQTSSKESLMKTLLHEKYMSISICIKKMYKNIYITMVSRKCTKENILYEQIQT